MLVASVTHQVSLQPTWQIPREDFIQTCVGAQLHKRNAKYRSFHGITSIIETTVPLQLSPKLNEFHKLQAEAQTNRSHLM